MAPEADSVVRVCSKSEVTPGSVKAFAVGDKTLAVYNIDGTFYWQLHQAFPGFDGEGAFSNPLRSISFTGHKSGQFRWLKTFKRCCRNRALRTGVLS